MAPPDAENVVVLEAPTEWHDPEPLFARDERLPYPVEKLPSCVRDAVLEVSDALQAPLAMVATNAIAALAASAQPLVDVRRADGLEGPVSLYTLVIASSGERKSAAAKKFFGPIEEREDEERARLAPVLEAYRTELAQWEAINEGLLRKLKNAAGQQKSPTAGRT